MNKQTLRENMLQMRNGFLPPYRTQASREICDQIKQLKVYQSATTILAYFSFRNEVSLYPLIEDAWKKGKTVALPRMEQDTLVPVRFTCPSELEQGIFHTLEPNVDCERVDLQDIDLVLVPGVAFDKQGYRLGFGKGHYDRFFAHLPNVYKLGIAYREQIVDFIYPESHDISMNSLVSNSEPFTV